MTPDFTTTTETPAPPEISEPTFTVPPPPAAHPTKPPGPLRRFVGAVFTAAARMGGWLNLLLVVLAFGTMFLAGGPVYALCTILILGSHEMGHYLTCRWYGVDATLPYFLPAPPPFLFGTFGAVIRMRPPIPSRRALFDIGIAGPIAGFVVALPVLAIGVAMSPVVENADTLLAFQSHQVDPQLPLGAPLLVQVFAHWFHGPLPNHAGLQVGPALFAGWFGLLVTAMNLFPVGQLDGGHVSFALSPDTHRALGRLVAVCMMVLVLVCFAMRILNPWLLWAVVLLILSRFRHPPVDASEEPLGAARVALAVGALLIFIVSFIPIPIQV